MERGGAIYTRDSRGALKAMRKEEWFTVVTTPGRKTELLKAAHAQSLRGSWHALSRERHVRRVYWQYMHYDCMFVVRKREERQPRKGKSAKDGAPPMETGPRAFERNDFASIDIKVLPGGKQMCSVANYLSRHIDGGILGNKTGLEAAKFSYGTFLRNDPVDAHFKRQRWRIPKSSGSGVKIRVAHRPPIHHP